jgi:hypothetical protein
MVLRTSFAMINCITPFRCTPLDLHYLTSVQTIDHEIILPFLLPFGARGAPIPGKLRLYRAASRPNSTDNRVVYPALFLWRPKGRR